ncbi:hypothetical protein ACIA8O_30730 [Kitasatospora sp. NPDC051853]|uniref:hypothetical protein n=1 Tax=Kitasatospora sp. NPDC051853 TaxID=3364058 RepID=UPI0037982112
MLIERRARLGAAALLVAGAAVLSGCAAPGQGATTSDGAPAATVATSAPAVASPSPSATEAFDVAEVLKAAGTAPYSAQVEISATMDNQVAQTMTGRLNFNSPDKGMLRVRSGDVVPQDRAVDMEVVRVGGTTYTRDLSKNGDRTWQQTAVGGSSTAGDYALFAQLLLQGGPGARKGIEQQGGVPAHHLSGRLTTDQVGTVDQETYKTLLAMNSKQMTYDVWVDAKGHVIRFEQSFTAAPSMKKARNIVVLSDFGPTVPVRAPK